MPVTYKKTVAVLEGTCAMDEAEPLLAWLTKHSSGRANLRRCTGLHAAVYQVLLARRAQVSVVPADPVLRAWLGADEGSAPG